MKKIVPVYSQHRAYYHISGVIVRVMVRVMSYFTPQQTLWKKTGCKCLFQTHTAGEDASSGCLSSCCTHIHARTSIKTVALSIIIINTIRLKWLFMSPSVVPPYACTTRPTHSCLPPQRERFFTLLKWKTRLNNNKPAGGGTRASRCVDFRGLKEDEKTALVWNKWI